MCTNETRRDYVTCLGCYKLFPREQLDIFGMCRECEEKYCFMEEPKAL